MDTQTVQAVVDRISIVQMQERYGLSTRQAVYDRLKKLNIKAVRGTIDTETELPRMDELHRSKQEPSSSLSTASTRQIEKSSRQLDNQTYTVWPELLQAFIEANRPQPAPQPSAIASLKERLELLELVATQGNTLSTSELAEVLGIKAKTLGQRDQHFQYGYLFLRAGKHGHELAWSVSRHTRKSIRPREA